MGKVLLSSKRRGDYLSAAPPRYILQWHCAPRRQYTITPFGEAEIEVGDGTVRKVGPGDVLLAEDLTGQGHITRVVGNQPRFYVVVPRLKNQLFGVLRPWRA